MSSVLFLFSVAEGQPKEVIPDVRRPSGVSVCLYVATCRDEAGLTLGGVLALTFGGVLALAFGGVLTLAFGGCAGSSLLGMFWF